MTCIYSIKIFIITAEMRLKITTFINGKANRCCMRVAVFGDINSQYKWLARILKQSVDEGVEKYVCHGDISRKICKYDAYSTDKCIELLEKHQVYCTLGNHEQDIIKYSQRIDISKKSLFFLKRLLEELVLNEVPEVLFTHKSPSRRFLLLNGVTEFYYMENNYPKQKIAFIGHSHRRYHIKKIEDIVRSNYFPVFNKRYDVSLGTHLINTGTTNFAFPFSFNFLPGYVIYDSLNSSFEFKKIYIN